MKNKQDYNRPGVSTPPLISPTACLTVSSLATSDCLYFQVAALDLPQSALPAPALPPVLPPAPGSQPGGGVLLPAGHQSGLSVSSAKFSQLS